MILVERSSYKVSSPVMHASGPHIVGDVVGSTPESRQCPPNPASKYLAVCGQPSYAIVAGDLGSETRNKHVISK